MKKEHFEKLETKVKLLTVVKSTLTSKIDKLKTQKALKDHSSKSTFQKCSELMEKLESLSIKIK
jgi:hypothetical protein